MPEYNVVNLTRQEVPTKTSITTVKMTELRFLFIIIVMHFYCCFNWRVGWKNRENVSFFFRQQATKVCRTG